ncbi:Oidioi.mRNA.OKI2018_I69.chr2.g7843.t1.cds [Oikopleura dioica]|uniref:Oidioi.mRNA.OKI2018_I69.chr2.g7843.t1.cds n=1 Tax=Oikopleura dioica TaxID=34765 RepID=A0ABN7T7G7_OIKDI|nr:Oidioi.mRNA.OKI2018_I69.chr2.g7843.t1.cds [Oikopleura dioica]
MLVSPAKGQTMDDVQENEPVKPAKHDTPLVPTHKPAPPEPPVPLPRHSKPRITDAELQQSKSSMIRHVTNDSEQKDREIRKLKRDNFEKDQIISMMETEIGILYEQIKW